MTVFVADEQGEQGGTGGVAVDLERIQNLARFVTAELDVPESMELSVLCVDSEAMQRLNAQHMGADGPTDVLAFPMDLPGEATDGAPAILGDVVLCPAVAAEHAATHGQPPAEEMEMLVVHGILHLLGHDHAEAEERRVMFSLTDDLLTAFRAEESK